jgi:phospho-N-acetylmuramoyl-pentapeptide-transferase
LRARRVGKQIRIEGPQTHQVKAGTPTMGGLMIIVPVVVISGVVTLINIIVEMNQGRPIANLGQQILVPVGTMVAFAVVGAIDDWENVRGKRVKGEGMSARAKMAFQALIATAVALVLHFGPSQLRSVAIPGVIEKIDIGTLWIPIAIFWIVGFSNAVNFTDGLDGLAGIISATAFMAYAVIAYLQSFAGAQPGVQPPVSSLVPFSLIVVGAILAFLWFNAHPAQLFMGDTDRWHCAALAVVALMTGQWLCCP